MKSFTAFSTEPPLLPESLEFVETKLLQVGSEAVGTREVTSIPQDRAPSEYVPHAAGGCPLSCCRGTGKALRDTVHARSRLGSARCPPAVLGIRAAPLTPISGLPSLVFVVNGHAKTLEVRAQLVGLIELACGAQLLPVEQHVVDVALRSVRRRGAGRSLLHKGARLVVLLCVLGTCQGPQRITCRGTAQGHVPVSPVRGAVRHSGAGSRGEGPLPERGAVGGAGKLAPVREARGQSTERSVVGPSRSRLPSSRITHRARRLLVALRSPGHGHAGPQTGKSNSAGVSR